MDELLNALLEAYHDTGDAALNDMSSRLDARYDELSQDFSRHDSRYREIARLCRDALDDAKNYSFNEFLKCECKENERYLKLHNKAADAYCYTAQLIKERENGR